VKSSDDRELIKRLTRGDVLAFDEIFRRFNEKIFTFAYRNLRNKQDAEGIVQDVFFALWEEKSKLKEVINLDAWIFGICFNIIRKRFRQLARERTSLKDLSEWVTSEDNTTAVDVEYNDLLRRAENIIEQLPPRQKLIFNLSKIDGLSNQEISQKLKISGKTVENLLSKAKVYIRKVLVDERLISLLFFWMFIR
jgi:RNA polymerase sigma-70 factor (family 1)